MLRVLRVLRALRVLRIGHLKRGFLVCLVSGKIILDIDPELSNIWLWLRLIGL